MPRAVFKLHPFVLGCGIEYNERIRIEEFYKINE